LIKIKGVFKKNKYRNMAKDEIEPGCMVSMIILIFGEVIVGWLGGGVTAALIVSAIAIICVFAIKGEK